MALNAFNSECINIINVLNNSKISAGKRDDIFSSIEKIKTIFKSQLNNLNAINNNTNESHDNGVENTSHTDEAVIEIQSESNDKEREKFTKLSTDEKLDFMFDKILEIDLKSHQKTNNFNRYSRSQTTGNSNQKFNNFRNKNNNEYNYRNNFHHNNRNHNNYNNNYQNKNNFNQNKTFYNRNFQSNHRQNYTQNYPNFSQPFFPFSPMNNIYPNIQSFPNYNTNNTNPNLNQNVYPIHSTSNNFLDQRQPNTYQQFL